MNDTIVTSAQFATIRAYAASQPCFSQELRELDRMVDTKRRLERLFGEQPDTYDFYYAEASRDISQSTLNWVRRIVPLVNPDGTIA